MSLLLSLLGTTALLGATAVTPAMATLPKAEQQVESQLQIRGVYQINRTVSAEVSIDDANITDDSQLLNITIPWTDLKIDTRDYMNINWDRTTFRLSMQTHFQDNPALNSGTTQNKIENFAKLESGFSEKVVYKNGPVISAPGVDDNNAIEYLFSDDFASININARVWISIKDSTPEFLMSSITFLNILYNIVVY